MSQALLIESLIKRAGGTRVPIGQNEYHFKPQSAEPDAPHVALVADMGDAQRFLGIVEGYRLIGAAPEPTPAPTGLQPSQPAPQISTSAPAPVLQTDAQPAAPEGDGQGEKQTDDLAAMSLEDLRALYTAETGLKPHNRAGAETLAKLITAHRLSVAGAAAQPLGANPGA